MDEVERFAALCRLDVLDTADEAEPVEDATADPCFRENPMVLGAPHIRCYAGAPLVTGDGAAIGSLCVVDTQVRTASPHQQAMLLALADQVVSSWRPRSDAT